MRHGCDETRGEIQDLRETLEFDPHGNADRPTRPRLQTASILTECSCAAVDHAALSAEPLSVLMIDVDNFKHFNDTWGHLTGDQVLRLVAMSIKGEVRPTDTAARFGGEEFAILLPQSSLNRRYLVAERIRQTVMSRELVKRSTGEALGRLTVSVGRRVVHEGRYGSATPGAGGPVSARGQADWPEQTVSESDMADPKADPEPSAVARRLALGGSGIGHADPRRSKAQPDHEAAEPMGRRRPDGGSRQVVGWTRRASQPHGPKWTSVSGRLDLRRRPPADANRACSTFFLPAS